MGCQCWPSALAYMDLEARKKSLYRQALNGVVANSKFTSEHALGLVRGTQQKPVIANDDEGR